MRKYGILFPITLLASVQDCANKAVHALLETSFEVLGPSISMAFFKKVLDLIERSVYL